MTAVFTMHVERETVKQHGYHLGTDRKVAESFVLEMLRKDPQVRSIALRFGQKLVQMFDHRDIAEG